MRKYTAAKSIILLENLDKAHVLSMNIYYDFHMPIFRAQLTVLLLLCVLVQVERLI